MNLLHFEITQSKDLNDFVRYWSKLYSYSNEKIYSDTIIKNELEEDDIRELFKWKNGMRLSDLKQKSLEEKIISKLAEINNFKTSNDFDIVAFQKKFNNLSAVWKIFLLHIIKPNLYPIYDQHIHRSFLFIHKEEFSTISNDNISNKEKEQFYFDRYLKFIEANKIDNLKKLDEAFFAFGQFLNTKNYKKIFLSPAD